MAPHRIAQSVVHRPHWLGPALLAAVVATALLSAGQARANLINGPATCTGLGIERFCLPNETQEVFDPIFFVADDVDTLFSMAVRDTQIILTFSDPVTGMDLDGTGFQLSGLQSTPDLVVGEITDVTFINFISEPVTRPFVTNDDGVQTVQWTQLLGADPQLGGMARINLSFVPEPGTTLLLGLGLAGLGVVGRSRRQASQGRS